ncbi:23S rRNA (guanosine(2251)-2'-O)-methyltransferase RlmB [Indioceanicola profundi]|uniref:23S rRNA (guanosine(2251)-2'-O)-methyltransferase RlmB n=1 Tax=Indioceanicola profundi TaxID=2220096 RepID=UPI000E6AAB38|nr:23S rRNA (guanosine(2251)-2'-O)-methyltransferase RlmB [Indioceanicola profundi]
MKNTRQPPKGQQSRDRRTAAAAQGGPKRPSSADASARGAGKPQRDADRPARGAGATQPAQKTAPSKPGLQASASRANLLYGLHPVAAALVNPERQVRALFVTEGALESLTPALARAEELGLDRPEPTVADRDQLDRLLAAGAVHQGAALDCGPLPELDLEDVIARAEAAEGGALVVILDQVTDPHNVGAVMRSAAAFGAMAVVVQDRHAPPVTGVLAKTASGAVEAVPLVRVTNLARAITDLREANFWCVGLAESGERALHELELAGHVALVLGSEGEGIRRLTAERCDEIARLPTGGPVGSLNVSNAAAVALYEVARRR